MADAHEALTRQMLEWIDGGTHTYAELIEVWKSSCPRLTIWEDACADGLIDAQPGIERKLALTAKGRALLSRRHP